MSSLLVLFWTDQQHSRASLTIVHHADYERRPPFSLALNPPEGGWRNEFGVMEYPPPIAAFDTRELPTTEKLCGWLLENGIESPLVKKYRDQLDLMLAGSRADTDGRSLPSVGGSAWWDRGSIEPDGSYWIRIFGTYNHSIWHDLRQYYDRVNLATVTENELKRLYEPRIGRWQWHMTAPYLIGNADKIRELVRKQLAAV